MKLFIHYPTMKRYEIVARDIEARLKNTNFASSIDEVIINVPRDCKTPTFIPNIHVNTHVETLNGNLRDYEMPTLHALWTHAHSLEPSNLYAYVHLKGIAMLSVGGSDGSSGFRAKLLNNLAVFNASTFLNSTHSATGPNLVCSNPGWLHFSGNMWIAKGEHIRNLVEPTYEKVYKRIPFWTPPDRVSRGLGHHREDARRYLCEGWVGGALIDEKPTTFIDCATKNTLHYKQDADEISAWLKTLPSKPR
jgi:hypothetical protein